MFWQIWQNQTLSSSSKIFRLQLGLLGGSLDLVCWISVRFFFGQFLINNSSLSFLKNFWFFLILKFFWTWYRSQWFWKILFSYFQNFVWTHILSSIFYFNIMFTNMILHLDNLKQLPSNPSSLNIHKKIYQQSISISLFK